MADKLLVNLVTTAELATLVSTSGLVEGLQYKNTETGVLVLAVSSTEYVLLTRSYKEYVARISQDTALANPTVLVFANTIGAISWVRNSVGKYYGTLDGAFPFEKTFIPYFGGVQGGITAPIYSNALADHYFNLKINYDSNSILLFVYNATTDTAVDLADIYTEVPIEIKVYY